MTSMVIRGDPQVRAALDELVAAVDRDRSWVVNEALPVAGWTASRPSEAGRIGRFGRE